jgi:preprotein translocase subunit SecE
MATEEDLEKTEKEEEEESSSSDADQTSSDEESDDKLEVRAKADSKADEAGQSEADAVADGDSTPVQLGYQRYVYAAYMAGALIVAFLAAKIGHVAWYRLGQWKPEFGEPVDDILYPAAVVVGIVVALYYWRKQDARQYANEVAEELSKVTWPSRKEVTNSTTVVVLTTLFATVFFALMDRFWSFITDKIYTF